MPSPLQEDVNMGKQNLQTIAVFCTVVGTTVALLTYIDAATTNNTPRYTADSVVISGAHPNTTRLVKYKHNQTRSDTKGYKRECRKPGKVCDVTSGKDSKISGYDTVTHVNSGRDTIISRK